MSDATYPSGGEFEIHSHPIFLLEQDGESEILVFDAQMTVETGEAQELANSRRRVPVRVASWVAKAWSQLLDQELTLALTEDEQPPSHVTALEPENDFPGNLEFNMLWDLSVGGETVMNGLEGRAVGSIRGFPPKADVFEIQGKDVRIGNVAVRPIACACASETFLGRMVSAT